MLALVFLAMPMPAQAGKLSWLDDVVREVIAEARAGGRSVVKGGHGARVELRSAGRLFVGHDAEEGLEQLVRRSDELARAGRRIERPTEALLETRFTRLLGSDSQAVAFVRGTQAGRKAAGGRDG